MQKESYRDSENGRYTAKQREILTAKKREIETAKKRVIETLATFCNFANFFCKVSSVYSKANSCVATLAPDLQQCYLTSYCICSQSFRTNS